MEEGGVDDDAQRSIGTIEKSDHTSNPKLRESNTSKWLRKQSNSPTKKGAESFDRNSEEMSNTQGISTNPNYLSIPGSKHGMTGIQGDIKIESNTTFKDTKAKTFIPINHNGHNTAKIDSGTMNIPQTSNTSALKIQLGRQPSVE